jgi:adenylate cyclase class 1
MLRLQKFTNSLSSKVKIDLIDSLPYLISTNIPGLPGYIDDYRPIGIYGYSSSAKAPLFIKSRFPSVLLPPGFDNSRPLLELFAIMGSAGSIAFNEESDIDFWLCLDEKKADAESLKFLRAKLREIEFWITDNFSIETHFYLNDIERIRNDLFDTNEDSFGGKANGKLLKDEFYRSSILLNGKIPFWWVVPAGIEDSGYDECIRALDSSAFSRDYVDFGNLHTIDRQDFIGGGLFQILKSLGNPFKSIIKIGVVEKYLLDKDSESILLCNMIKKSVLEGKLNINHIDPYVMMFNQVNDFYSQNRDPDHALASEIIKMCFYIKIDPNLSETAGRPAAESEKIEKMTEYIKKWKWSDVKIHQMDTFKDWDITPINKFWNSITGHILKSYKRILKNIQGDEFIKRFSTEDIKFITTKINSSFSLSEKKIRPAISFKDNPIEKHLKIESISEKEGKINWLLSKGFSKGQKDFQRLLIHKEPTLIALLAWISMNRMFQKDHTRVEIKSRYQLLDSNFVRELMNELTLHFSIKRLNIKNDYFFMDPLPLLNFIIINLYSKYPQGIEDIIYLYHNSWGETLYEQYSKETDLSGILVQILNGALLSGDDYDRSVYMISPYPYGSSKPFKRIQNLFREMHRFFIRPADESHIDRKYITTLGNSFCVFSYRKIKGKAKISCAVYDSELKMLYSLSNISGKKLRIMIDPELTSLNYLKVIIDNFKNDAVQIYFQKERKYSYFFVSDEQGSLIFYRVGSEHFKDYLSRLNLFAKNSVMKVLSHNPHSPLKGSEKNIILYELTRDSRDNCSVSGINRELKEELVDHEKTIQPFKIVLSILDKRDIAYQHSLPFGSLSDSFTKQNPKKVLRDLSVYMGAAEGYNFYVTDIDLTKLGPGIYRNATSYGFSEKNKFELLMERSLKLEGRSQPAAPAKSYKLGL